MLFLITLLFLVKVHLIGAQRPVVRRVGRGWEAPLPGGAPCTPRGCRGPSCSRGQVGGACQEPRPQAVTVAAWLVPAPLLAAGPASVPSCPCTCLATCSAHF